MFVPGGQIAGMALMSFGADVVIQKATTGEVNWAQSAAMGVTGAIGGAGFAAARAAMANSTARLGGYVAINAGANGATGAAAGGLGYGIKNRGNSSWRGLAGAMLGGGISGAIGGLAGPAGGTLAKAGGHSAYTFASGTRRQTVPAFWAQTGLGAGGSIIGMVTDKAVAGGEITAVDLGWSAATGGLLTHMGGGPAASNTLSQAAYTNPSTWAGFVRQGPNGVAILRSAGLGASATNMLDIGKHFTTND